MMESAVVRDEIQLERIDNEVEHTAERVFEDIKDELEDVHSLRDEKRAEEAVEEVKKVIKTEMDTDSLVKNEIREKIDEAYARDEFLGESSSRKNGYDNNGYVENNGTHLKTEVEEVAKERTKEEMLAEMGSPLKEDKFKPIVCALIICLGSFNMGAVIGYSSPAVPSMNVCCDNPFHINTDQNTWVGSIITLAALFGGLVGGIYMDKVGRRLGLLIMSVPMAAGWIIIVASPNYGCLLAGRALTGLIMGVLSVICPVYLGEISPASIRGVLGSCHQLLVCIGILYVYCFGSFLNWQWLVIAILAFLLLMVIGLCFVVESPRYLLSTGQREQCKEALIWLRGHDGDVTREILELEIALESSKDKAKFSEFTQPQLWKPLAISIWLMIFQQFSGINVVMLYTVQIFTMAHLTMDPNVQTIVVGVVGVVGTCVSVAVSDLVGRRILLMASGALMMVSMAGLGTFFWELYIDPDFASGSLGWLPVTALVLFNFGFDVAYGPIPWVMMGELFPQRAKGLASSISTAINWLCAFIITKFWQNMTDAMGVYGGYWFCTGICAVSIVFTIMFVPETKGKSLEEIEENFK